MEARDAVKARSLPGLALDLARAFPAAVFAWGKGADERIEGHLFVSL